MIKGGNDVGKTFTRYTSSVEMGKYKRELKIRYLTIECYAIIWLAEKRKY